MNNEQINSERFTEQDVELLARNIAKPVDLAKRKELLASLEKEREVFRELHKQRERLNSRVRGRDR